MDMENHQGEVFDDADMDLELGPTEAVMASSWLPLACRRVLGREGVGGKGSDWISGTNGGTDEASASLAGYDHVPRSELGWATSG